MSEHKGRMIELHYTSDYEDPETGEIEHDKQSTTVVSCEAYVRFFYETESEPCMCEVRGCLSCFLDETNGWAEGYAGTCTELWFGIDPATGKQWEADTGMSQEECEQEHGEDCNCYLFT